LEKIYPWSKKEEKILVVKGIKAIPIEKKTSHQAPIFKKSENIITSLF